MINPKWLLIAAWINWGADLQAQQLLEVGDTYEPQCQQLGQLLRRCEFNSFELALPVSHAGEIFETVYSIEWRFQCRGDALAWGLSAAENQVRSLRSRQQVQHTSLRGSAALRLVDPDPRATEGLHFRAPCRFELLSVESAPSAETVELWLERQGRLTELRDSYRELLNYVGDYLRYSSWRQSQQRLLLGSLQTQRQDLEAECAAGEQSACTTAFHLELLESVLLDPLVEDIEPQTLAIVLDHYRIKADFYGAESAEWDGLLQVWGVAP